MLEHEADAPVAGSDPGDVAAVQRDAPVIDFDEPGDGAQQRALAAAGGAEEDEELALLDLERDVVDDRMRLIPLGDLVECNGHAEEPAGPASVNAERLVPGRFAGQSRTGNKSVTGAGIGTGVAGPGQVLGR